MDYISTRGKSKPVKSKEAIMKGLAPDGGLYVPELIPEVSLEYVESLAHKTYSETALSILSLFLTDFSENELREAASLAYCAENFDDSDIAPVREIRSSGFGFKTGGYVGADPIYVLELFHGPTCAFKDLALQLLPRLLVMASAASGDCGETVILVATSGDTGKAALEGFKDVPGTRIVVFYPENGVSEVQKLQMVSQRGGNVAVIAVKGNFDDAQTGVKIIFRDAEFQSDLLRSGMKLSSANSINWGRLAPQIAYYFRAYAQLILKGVITPGEKVTFTVPTGNFGNILAGWYAYKMGLPVKKLVCASNSNKVLTDFINTGVYDRRREFVTTMSPSMDILISSNLERLLFEIADRDAPLVRQWMQCLSEQGAYDVGERGKKRVREIFWGGFATEEETSEIIREVFSGCNYLMDTHTAVGMKVYCDYKTSTGDGAPAIIVSTASPYKFARDVLESIEGEGRIPDDEIECLNKLESVSGVIIPDPLKDIDKRRRIHFASTEKEDMKTALEEALSRKE